MLYAINSLLENRSFSFLRFYSIKVDKRWKKKVWRLQTSVFFMIFNPGWVQWILKTLLQSGDNILKSFDLELFSWSNLMTFRCKIDQLTQSWWFYTVTLNWRKWFLFLTLLLQHWWLQICLKELINLLKKFLKIKAENSNYAQGKSSNYQAFSHYLLEYELRLKKC